MILTIPSKFKILLSLLFLFIVGVSTFYLLSFYQHKKIDAKGVFTKNISASQLPKEFYGTKKMVLVPKGSFIIGDNNLKFSDEKPAHAVDIQAFYMDETPVTYDDFIKYVNDGGTKSRYWEYDSYNQPQNPVSGINWYHAVDYCNWRSEKEGLKPAYKLSGQLDAWGYPAYELDDSIDGYRLPTEAEFEYAARGGLQGRKFPWGDNFDASLANYDNERGLMTGDWWRLAKVTDTKPNGYGLYGMSGNVWQWTNDWYGQNYYASSTRNNPMGPKVGSAKVMRGGSWGSISPEYLQVDKRSYMAPSNYNYDVGFRCIRSAKNDSLKPATTNIKPQREFYKYDTAHISPIKIDLYGSDFLERLTKYLSDFYPNSIYFQVKVDKQEVITPHQMAELIVKVSKEYSLHPLFLTGIMASESGFGCCSFPRWYNNPMAYHWQNALMNKGLPTYDADASHNRKYKDLEDAFRQFSAGIKRDIYINASKKDLNTFHLLYVGYKANEWMYTLSKVYKDMLGVQLEPNIPATNVGQYIYVTSNKPVSTSVSNSNDLKIVEKPINWGYVVPTKPRAIDTIIIHSSYDTLSNDVYSVDGVIHEYNLYTAGPNYLIGRGGTIYRLVQEKNIGWHAGASKMPDGRTNINDFSIGIEMIYNENETPNEIQYQQLSKLVKDIKSRYNIKNILGHSQIAPKRKTDPWNFDWEKLNRMTVQ